MKKINYFIAFSLFILVGSNSTAINKSTQERIDLLNERMKQYDLRWQKVSDYLELEDLYRSLSRLEDSKKALENAYAEKDKIRQSKLDSNEYVGSMIVLTRFNRIHKNWQQVFELSKSLLDDIDNKHIVKAHLLVTSYPAICGNAATALLSMQQPDAAINYIEKGLAWSGKPTDKNPTSDELKIIKDNRLSILYAKAQVYQNGYHDKQTAKQIYQEILSTYSDLTNPAAGRKLSLPDENDKSTDALIIIKQNLDKLN